MIFLEFKSEQEWLNAIKNEILKTNPKTIALSGGTTPKSLYQNFPQGDYIFYQVDERYVPHDHPDSNFKLIKETLNPKNFHFFDTNLKINEALKKYKTELPENFDLCLLGIGPDGHTASLFPHSQGLLTSEKIAHTTTNEFAVKDRLTITFPQILNSKKLLILLKDRPEILQKLKAGNSSIDQFPALKLLEHRDATLVHLHFSSEFPLSYQPMSEAHL